MYISAPKIKFHFLKFFRHRPFSKLSIATETNSTLLIPISTLLFFIQQLPLARQRCQFCHFHRHFSTLDHRGAPVFQKVKAFLIFPVPQLSSIKKTYVLVNKRTRCWIRFLLVVLLSSSSLYMPLNLDTIYVSFTAYGPLRVRNTSTCAYDSINWANLGYKPPSPITYGPLLPHKHTVLYTKNTYLLLLKDRSSIHQDRPWYRF